MISSYTTGLRLMSEGRDFRGRLWLAFFAALLLACLAKRDTLLWVEEGRDDEMQIIKNTGAALSLETYHVLTGTDGEKAVAEEARRTRAVADFMVALQIDGIII